MMKKLELLIPPVALVVIFMILMIVIKNTMELYSFYFSLKNMTAFGVCIIGVAIILLGVIDFKKAKTTVNPMQPENTTNIVDSGIYHLSRNPMYLGMFMTLVGFAIYLGSLSALLLTSFFIAYMNRFQIKPEEQVLETHFGEEYLIYKEKVRRWL